jgi:DNA polymerase III alpha subunit
VAQTKDCGCLAFAEVVDETGTFEVVIFSDVYMHSNGILVEGPAVTIQGFANQGEENFFNYSSIYLARNQTLEVARQLPSLLD